MHSCVVSRNPHRRIRRTRMRGRRGASWRRAPATTTSRGPCGREASRPCPCMDLCGRCVRLFFLFDTAVGSSLCRRANNVVQCLVCDWCLVWMPSVVLGAVDPVRADPIPCIRASTPCAIARQICLRHDCQLSIIDCASICYFMFPPSDNWGFVQGVHQGLPLMTFVPLVSSFRVARRVLYPPLVRYNSLVAWLLCCSTHRSCFLFRFFFFFLFVSVGRRTR